MSSSKLFLIALVCSSSILFAGAARAGQFDIQVGDYVEEGSPDEGAGYLDERNDVDVYRFTATAGQLIFVEELSGDDAFNGWLWWELVAPSGERVFGDYFDDTNPGRVKLEESGTYRIRVLQDRDEHPGTGSYSFALHSIPPDTTFQISIGDTVSLDEPQSGAGAIEVAGAQDVYKFTATAGQHVFFEDNGVDEAFDGWLFWELHTPGGTRLFSEYFDSENLGRVTLPESGVYTLRVASGREETSQQGEYSFRLRAISPDQEFTLQVGATVSDAVPTAGAGRIEMAGARDIYRFQGTAGQALFFEDVDSSSEFDGWLHWQVLTPSGSKLFNDYFDSTSPGRIDLKESGTYTIVVEVPRPDTSYVGSYSFRIRDIAGDTRYPLALGQVVSIGVPGAGAGNIESPGGEDQYKFEGLTGQRLAFEELSFAESFAGWLFWEVKRPSGTVLLQGYFDEERLRYETLPESGVYTVRVYVNTSEPAHVGAYSFRIYAPVVAWADQLITAPGKPLLVPSAKFLCNDVHELGDSLTVELMGNESAQGGALSLTSDGVLYLAKTGFTGIDTFPYRLRGNYGGEDTGLVTVRVYQGADGVAMVVSVNRAGPGFARVCMLGRANHTYQVEQSTNMVDWSFRENLSASSTGEMEFEYPTTEGVQRFFRFR